MREICQECQETKFNKRKVANIRGIKIFRCTDCKEISANFIQGQTYLCHRCAIKMGKCVVCGKLL